jgi:alkylation response protein AidB-like acyl-CoA dehydrogenase
MKPGSEMNSPTISTNSTREALVAAAKGMIPMLRSRGQEISATRRVPDDVFRLLKDAGLMQLMRPHKYGGPEIGPDVLFQITRELSKGDGSTAWVYAVTNSHDHFISFYPESVQDTYWASAKPLSASSYIPVGKAAPAEGGFRLSGKWGWSSGIENSGWVVVGAIVGMLPGDRPAPDLRFFLLPESDYKVLDDWHVLGLCGTGSKTVVIEDVFVPNERILSNEDIKNGTTPGGKVHAHPLYRASAWPLFGFCITAPAVGLVQGAYDIILEQVQARAAKPDHMFEARKTAGFMKLSEVSAQIDAATLLYDRGLTETARLLDAGQPLPVELKARNRRDQTYGTALLRQAMATLIAMTGGSGMLESNHIQRAFRDLQTLSAHPGGNWEVASIGYGSVMCGGDVLEPLF